MKNKFVMKKIIYILLLCIIATFIYFKFFKKNDKTVFITKPVIRTNIQKVVNATGEVGVVKLVNIGSRVSGQIEKLYVELGQEVKEGDLIAEIDSITQKNDVDLNKAKLNSYNAQLTASKIALKIAESQYQRAKKMFASKAISKEVFEKNENSYELAKSEVIQIEAAIKQTLISLSTAEQNLSYTKIKSTMNGTIVSVPVKEGQTVNANMTTPTIVQIADLNEMEVLMEISEGDIVNIKDGSVVEYNILGDLLNKYKTTLKSIDPALTLLTNGTYTGVVGSSQAIYYYGRLVLPNQDRKLRIGMTTQNTIYVDSVNNVIAVPAIAITLKNDKRYVKILKSENITEEREVIIGLSDGVITEIKSGVSENEIVVLGEMSASQINEKIDSTESRIR